MAVITLNLGYMDDSTDYRQSEIDIISTNQQRTIPTEFVYCPGKTDFLYNYDNIEHPRILFVQQSQYLKVINESCQLLI